MHPKNTQRKIPKEKELISQSFKDSLSIKDIRTDKQILSIFYKKNTNKFSLEKEIQKLGATPEQIERARQRMEEYKKATGTVIRHIERYFLAVLKNLVKFEKITGINTNKRKPSYERDREYHRKTFEALLMS